VTDAPSPPLLLSHRLGLHPPGSPSGEPLVLRLTAEERTRLRGLRHSPCGMALLLQLPRGEALRPGEWLAASDGLARVRVEAAAEPLLLVRADDPLPLLRAAYHLGNRHVALEVRPGELRLLADPVLEGLLRQRGLEVRHGCEPFQPEPGAYGGASDHHHSHPPSTAQPTHQGDSESDDA
jgi:urease accessory protein